MDKYTVIGNPIQHSLSPSIHRLFAQQTGQQIDYSRTLAPLDQFAETLEKFRSEGGKGANITLPFKQVAINYADMLTERAREAGVINTILLSPDGKVWGDNTDGVGLLRDLQDNLKFSIRGKKILILGAGGAVQGILSELLRAEPREILIANRNMQKAQQLIEKFGNVNVLNVLKVSVLSDIVSYPFDLIINGTSAGVKNENLSLVNRPLGPATLCYDLSYSNKLTSFLQWSQANGAGQLVDGLGMLIEQAAESFYFWRGIRPNTSSISSIIRNAMNA